jgi:hypothetical protein
VNAFRGNEFEGFEYVNPLLMTVEDQVWKIHFIEIFSAHILTKLLKPRNLHIIFLLFFP